MNIETAKTLRAGDKLSGIRRVPGCEIMTVGHVFEDGVDMQCTCGRRSTIQFDNENFWSGVERAHEKHEEIKRAIRALNVGDKVKLKGASHLTGTVFSVNNIGVTFDWCGDGSGTTWKFSDDLNWDMLTILPAEATPASTPYKDVVKERDPLAQQNQELRARITELDELTDGRNKQVAHLRESRRKWITCAFDEHRKSNQLRRELTAASGKVEDATKQVEDYKKCLADRMRVATNWEEDAKREGRNAQYYRDLLLQIAEVLGPEKYVCDSGDVSQDVLLAKVPELARAAILRPLTEKVKANIVPAPAPTPIGEKIRQAVANTPVVFVTGEPLPNAAPTIANSVAEENTFMRPITVASSMNTTLKGAERIIANSAAEEDNVVRRMPRRTFGRPY